MKCFAFLSLLLLLAPAASEDDRILFEFVAADAAEQWQTVNDGVMGGRSDGRFRITNEKHLEFSGALSLENNGGFASVRTRPTELDLKKSDTLVAKVRGDGREYSFNLYVPTPLTAFSYRARFPTKKDEWIEVSLPLDQFIATSFGEIVANQPLDASRVNGLGILLGDKKAGPFKLEIESISVKSGSPVPTAMLVQRDIAYVEAGHERHKLDVYTPTESKKGPVVFWIHGGGWEAGDKSSVQAKPQAFVKKGFVFVSTNYRLLPDGTIKQMGEDVAKVIHWVHDHIQEYGGDPNRLFVMGHSAGAQLAALVCIDDRFLNAEGISPKIIKGCVPVDGDTYDVPLQIVTVDERVANIYRRKFGDEASQQDLSPVTHVAEGKHIPPVLVLHVADHPETKAQSNRLVSVLQEAGFRAKTYPAQNKDHASINADLGLPNDPVTQAMFEFVEDSLQDKDP